MADSTRVQKSLALTVAEILHGMQNSKTGQLTLTTPLSRKIFFFGRVGLAMVNQCTKFEVSRFTGYEAMNGSAKCKKMGGLGLLGGIECHGNAIIRQSA